MDVIATYGFERVIKIIEVSWLSKIDTNLQIFPLHVPIKKERRNFVIFDALLQVTENCDRLLIRTIYSIDQIGATPLFFEER